MSSNIFWGELKLCAMLWSLQATGTFVCCKITARFIYVCEDKSKQSLLNQKVLLISNQIIKWTEKEEFFNSAWNLSFKIQDGFLTAKT